MAKPMMKPPMKGMPMPAHKGPMPPPPPMPKARAPVPMGGVGPGAMGAMPQAQAPQGYAWGTADTSGGAGRPLPNMSSQAGSWTGPMGSPPPPPEEPKGAVPLGLSTLRSLGQRAKPQGYASGTPDVSGGGSEFAKLPMTNPEPTPGYDPQTASYPELDDHFVAHLRAAMGMAPKVQKFAGGTPNVGPVPFSQQGGQSPLDSLLSGSLGPLQVGSAAAYAAPDNLVNHQMPAPNEGPAIAPPSMRRAAPVTPPTFGQELANMFPGQPAPPPEPQYAPKTVGHVMGTGQPAPTFGALLQGLTAQAPSMHVHADGTVTSPPDPNKVKTAADTAGSKFGQAYAMMHPDHFTEQNFIDEIKGMPLAVAEKLWNMQHYLDPQQQVESDYSKQLQAGVDTAAQELQNAQSTAGTPAGKLQEFQAALAKQQAEQSRHRQVRTEGQGAYYQQPSQ